MNNIPENFSELSILLTTDSKIQELNRDFRAKDKPTDVLSFAALDQDNPMFLSESLGDLIVSLDTAERQAKEYEVSLNEEAKRLIIHGVLHLLGYDHENVAKKTAALMFQTQAEFIERYQDIAII